MHHKYGKDGFVLISVSVDPPEGKARALEFLQKQKATFLNLWLDETVDTYLEYFDIAGPPAQLIYGRDGKLARRINAEIITHHQVEALIEKLLQAGK